MKISQEMTSVCACTQLRMAARVMTRLYDDALRGVGLRSSQLTVLAAIDTTETVSIAALSKTLAMDRTTLSRNLKPLIAEGLVALGDEGWRRSKTVHITQAGKERIRAAAPLWRAAQEDVLRRFGKKRWEAVHAQLQDIIGAA
jgi:DNA-binding MarR family transcriptional regulator